jgi:transcriptional regulator with XRE-family HTH domain
MDVETTVAGHSLDKLARDSSIASRLLLVTANGHGRNERLADAMQRRRVTSETAAEVLGVDPRTVDRWVQDRGRIPRASSRDTLASMLDVPVGTLWPSVHIGPSLTGDVLAAYPTRSALPRGHLMTLLAQAERNVDVLALAALWLWDSVPDFGPTLAAKAAAGVNVRVCLGDPEGEACRLRGEEEEVGSLIGARSRLAINAAERWLAATPSSLRLHDATLYATILRFDNIVLLNWHLFGIPAAEAPVLHLRRAEANGMTETALRSFENVWERSYTAAAG